MNRYKQLMELLEAAQEDFEKFYDKGNKAAGTRVRKSMLDLRNIAQEIRLEVQNKKNDL